MGQHVQSNEMPLQTHLMVYHFEKWDLDIMGPINEPSKKNVHILLCTNHATEWFEEKTLLRDMAQAIIDFIYEEIFVYFGVP
jgi:hypothetical protein